MDVRDTKVDEHATKLASCEDKVERVTCKLDDDAETKKEDDDGEEEDEG